MKKKLLATLALALTLVLCLLPATALAATYTLEDDETVTVEVKDGVQTVNFTDSLPIEDDNPVFTTNKGKTYNTVIRLVCVDGSGTVNVRLHNAKIVVGDGNDQSIIDVVGSTTANVVLSGDIRLQDAYDYSYHDSALIHVSEGTLNLSGGGDDNISLFGDRDGALIGSNAGEDFTGSINLSNILVHMEDWGCGAVIGSGEQGAFNGNVVIGNGAEISFNSTYDDFTQIGQGDDATGSKGTISIEDGAMLYGDREDMVLNLGGLEGTGIRIELADGALLNAYTGAEIKAGLGDGAVVVNGNGNVVTEAPAETYYAQGEAFRVVDKDGNAVPYEMTLEDGVLTIKAPKGAKLTGALEDMQLLSTKGATELRFGSSVLPLAELYHGVGMQGDTVVLTKDGKLTIGGEDYSALLK